MFEPGLSACLVPDDAETEEFPSEQLDDLDPDWNPTNAEGKSQPWSLLLLS